LRLRKETKRRMRLLPASIFLFALIATFSGCGKSSEEGKLITVEIENGNDDGSVSVLKTFLPELCAGFPYGGSEGVLVGTDVSGGGDTIISRAFYRFNIKNWEDGDITFHLHCTYKKDSEVSIELYLINDFGPLPDSLPSDPQDVSFYWLLLNAGEKVGEETPSEGEWFDVTIPKEKIQEKKTEEGYLALMLKIPDEEKYGNVLGLSTYEYAVAHNEDIPYLTWEE